MSVRVLSESESKSRNLKIFAELQEKSLFTYQDEAGVHLCVVKGRVDEQIVEIVKISDLSNLNAIVSHGSIRSEFYTFNENNCLNTLEFATRTPTREEVEATRIRSELETIYKKIKSTIWNHPDRREGEDNVMMHFNDDAVVLTFFNLHQLEKWPNRDKIVFIVKSITD